MNGGGVEEFVYASTKTRKLTITPASVSFVSRGNAGASYAEQWFPTRAGGYPILCPVVDAAELFVPIDIPSGCTISKVEVLVRSSTTRTGANRWSPVVLVLPDNPTTPPQLLLAAVVYKRRIFKVSSDTNPISLRPLSTHRVNDGAPGADVVLPESNVGGFRSWFYRWALLNTWDAG